MEELLRKEMKACFDYFNENTNLTSMGFGLVRDKYPLAEEVSSLSATGYGLTSIIIGIDNGWLSYEEGYKRCLNTLNTVGNLEHKNGFMNRYINIKTGCVEWNSEISIIDTGIFICGALAVGEYFGGEIKEKATELYLRINWNWFVDKKVNHYRLGYKKRFYGHWNTYAEQLILYILGFGSSTYPISREVYNSFNRPIGDYCEYKDIIHSWFGALFTYQYSHCWIDFRNTFGTNWFDNSVKAILANKKYCLNTNCKTFKKGYWGTSSTITKKRYSGRHGGEPCIDKIKPDGTVSISAVVSSIVFVPDEVLSFVSKLYNEYPDSFGKYGFKTSFNLKGEPWFCEEYLGIDKGTSLVMLYNYLNDGIWKLLMNNQYIKKGMEILK